MYIYTRVMCEHVGVGRFVPRFRLRELLEDRSSLRCFARRGLDAQGMEELKLDDVFSISWCF